MRRLCAGVSVVCLLGLHALGGSRISAAQHRDDGPRTASAGELIISEFRLRGPNGPDDEFIEIYNASGGPHTVAAASGTGYGIAASDGTTRCTIPNGTVIPNRGHFLCASSNGYSLGAYPAGNGTTATGDATFTTDIPDNAGIAIFNNNSGGGSYSVANRLDAVGSTSESNTTYKEGTGYPALTPTNGEYSFTRRPGGGCAGSIGGTCNVDAMQTTPPIANPLLADTGNNASDFMFVDPNGDAIGAAQRLGAPGPENLSSPIARGGAATVVSTRLDTCAAPLAAPNQVRDLTAAGTNAPFGTLDLRRTWTNTSGDAITRLRFRIVDISTFLADANVADFRPRSSSSASVTVDRPPCGTGLGDILVQGTTVEEPPFQVNGSGFNGSMSVASVTPGTPLADGATIDVRFLLGVHQTGIGRFCVVPETLPATSTQPFCFIGNTESAIVAGQGDFDFDQKSEMPVYNPATGQWKLLKSSSGYTTARTIDWGGAGFTPVPGDYDGDGRLDVAIYQKSTGVWSVLTSSSNYTRAFSVSWGGPGYSPVPGDYDGDGIADIALHNPLTGGWYILTSTTAYSGSMTFFMGDSTFTPVGGQDFDGDGRSDLVAYQEKSGAWLVVESSTGFTTPLVKDLGGVGDTLVPGDYDGDGKADLAVYARATGVWSIRTSSSGYTSGFNIGWGGPGYLPVPGDFDGDRKTDIAVYQPATNQWLVLKSSSNYMTSLTVTFGTSADMPISSAIIPVSGRVVPAGDFDGDAASDLTVYNPASGVWSTLTSSSGFTGATNRAWGGSGYAPAPGDYDGDGKGDLGLYQPSTGMWYVLLSGTNFHTSLSRGAGGAGYVPVPGDYDGDGQADVVVYNTTTGLWFGLLSSTNYTTTVNVSWGGTGYTAVPGDFDGDGKLDLGVYQASTGTWSILTSSSHYTASIVRNFGGGGYTPVPADFDGDGITDFAVYQPSTGIWTMLESSTGNTLGFTVSYGGAAYAPVAGDWDGDGRADVGVYNAASGQWSILLSSGSYTTSLSKNWGGAGYAPVPNFP